MTQNNKKHFCILPWIHMHIWPAGKVYPCCLSHPEGILGDTKQQTLEEIWNGEPMRNLRLNMINDIPSQVCRRCYELEESNMTTLRIASNTNFKHHLDKVKETKPDGTLENMSMAYMDIRFSNICNLKCRSCGPQFSSSWFEDHKKLFGNPGHPSILRVRDDMLNFMEELRPLLDSVEKVYWAGGEPLITEEHYTILDYWIEKNMKSVKMDYTTNFSQMRFKKKSIFEYWNSFDHVRVAASLDANHQRGEYLRKNIDWNKIVQNRKEMIKECPNVYFEITPTVSVYNVFNLPDFHKEWIEEGLLEPNNFRINLLLDPTYMRVQILPASMKNKIRFKYEKHIEYLESFENTKEVINNFKNILTYLDSDDKTNEITRWFAKTSVMDELRSENIFETFPELKGILDE